MTTKKYGILLIFATLSLSGCSEEYGSGADQEIYLHTSPEGAHCSLSNKRGAWEVYKTPEHINVTRGREALQVNCADYKGWTGQARVGANGSISGVADAVGSIQVDTIDSVFMKYPDNVTVKLLPPTHDTTGGENLGGISEDSLNAIERKREAEAAALNPPPAAPSPLPAKKAKAHSKSVKARESAKKVDDCLPAGMRPAR